MRRVGDASYSIASRKIFDQRVANLEKCRDCKGKGLPNVDHVTVNAGLFVRRSDSFGEGPGGLASHHHTRGSRAVIDFLQQCVSLVVAFLRHAD